VAKEYELLAETVLQMYPTEKNVAVVMNADVRVKWSAGSTAGFSIFSSLCQNFLWH